MRRTDNQDQNESAFQGQLVIRKSRQDNSASCHERRNRIIAILCNGLQIEKQGPSK